METDFPDSDTARPLLDAYFPKRLRESFAQYFPEHYLRREIVGCVAINHLVNNAGIAFLSRTMTTTQAGIGEVVKAYIDSDRSTGAFEERLGPRGRTATPRPSTRRCSRSRRSWRRRRWQRSLERRRRRPGADAGTRGSSRGRRQTGSYRRSPSWPSRESS